MNRTQDFNLGVHENNAKPSKGILWLIIYPHYYVKSNRRLNNSNQPLSVILELLGIYLHSFAVKHFLDKK